MSVLAEGLNDVTASVFGQASQQRYHIDLMSNLVTRVPNSAHSFAETIVRTIYQQPP